MPKTRGYGSRSGKNLGPRGCAKKVPRMSEYSPTHKDCRACRHSRTAVPRGSFAALFLEFLHRGRGGDLDLAADDGALGDCDGARAHLAANHGGIADLQFAVHLEAARDLAGDDGLLRLD